MTFAVAIIFLLLAGLGWLISWVSDWTKERVSPVDHKELRRQQAVEARNRRAEENRRQRQTNLELADKMWLTHADLVEKFMEIAERKVSVLDDYGDESWESLPKLIADCLGKIAEREGIDSKRILDWLKGMKQAEGRGSQFSDFYLRTANGAYLTLAKRLETEFRELHALQKGLLSTQLEFSNFSGVDFEVHVGRVLAKNGFEDIRGTATTGDQGADLLATREGRLHIIQVKCHRAAIGNKAVQEVVAALRFYGGHEAWVVTNSTFTPAAKALAQKNDVRLVDGVALARLTKQD